jgi:hypothetical protein
MPVDFDERLELFFGETSDAVARVYARLRGFDLGAELSGNLTGPSCMYAETLPARFALVDRGPGGSLLAEAVVPEPCFWTPEMPQLYQANVRLRRDGNVLARAERLLGLRALGPANRNLFYHGKRWVLRGAYRRSLTPQSLAQWHAGDVAMVVREGDDPLFAQASRVGVLIVVELEAADPDAIRRLARWPAVAVVALPLDAAVDLDGLAHNLLIAARVAPNRPLAPPRWAHLMMCELTPGDQRSDEIAGCPLPVIAAQVDGKPFSSIAQARAACDNLQRCLAPHDLAGYIV